MRLKSRENDTRLSRSRAKIVYQQHATMGAHIAVDQCTYVMVLCQKDPIFFDCLSQQRFVTRIPGELSSVHNIIAAIA